MTRNDYAKAAAIVRCIIRSVNDLNEVLEPHKDEVAYYIDGLYPESIKDVFLLDDLGEIAFGLSEEVGCLDDLARGKEPEFDLSYMFQL